MQLELHDVAIRGAGVAWKGESVALGVKFEAPLGVDGASALGIRDALFNGNGGPRPFVSQVTGLVVSEAEVTIVQHPDLSPHVFQGKLSGVVVVQKAGGLHLIFRVTIDVAQPILQYVAQQKKDPVLNMTISGMTQSKLDFDDDDADVQSPKPRGRKKK